uniref:Uncharacterized protein n=1 Tax=Myotis myotis TaxID=51298 RepID=A0A7J7UPL6_MYOMY|nr:hypothetical protein mMyoMyo1_008592 [Myotis myotis]
MLAETPTPRPSCGKSCGYKVGAVHLMHFMRFGRSVFLSSAHCSPWKHTISLPHLWSKPFLSLSRQDRVAAVDPPLRLLHLQLSCGIQGMDMPKGVLRKPLWKILEPQMPENNFKMRNRPPLKPSSTWTLGSHGRFWSLLTPVFLLPWAARESPWLL